MKQAILLLLAGAMFALFSCSKKSSSTPPNAQFVGTWHGTFCVTGSPAATEIINAGSDGSTVTIADPNFSVYGFVSCSKSVVFTGKVSGNTFIISQSVTDNCGNTGTLYIKATLTGGTLTMNGSITAAPGAPATSDTVCFTGQK